MRKLFLFTVCMVLLCVGCGTGWDDELGGNGLDGGPGGGSSTVDGSGNDLNFEVAIDAADEADYTEVVEVIPTSETDDAYEDFVENYTPSTIITVTYSGATATVSPEVDGVTVDISGANVVVNHQKLKGVEYVLTGSTTDGSFKVYGDKKFKLSLQGVSLVSSSRAAINIQASKRVYLVLAGENSLADASTYTATTADEDMKACLFSEGQLLISGTGSLTVAGNCKHAVASDDYIHLHSGMLTVTNAVKDGIHTNDKFVMGGGALAVTASSDGIECEEGYIELNAGKVTVNAVDDAITASYETVGDDDKVTPYIKVAGGLIKVNTTGEKGMGLKCTGDFTMTGGTVQAQVSGDGAKGISCDGNMELSGGKVTVLTSGNPALEYSSTTSTIPSDLSSAAGIKCDGTLLLSGTTLALKSTGKGGKGINCDGALTIQGGTIEVITTGTQYTDSRNRNLDTSSKGIRSEGDMLISGGTVRIMTTGGEGSEGLESKANLRISDGTIEIYAYDDAVNVSATSGEIAISGGQLYAYSSGNDGIDSNGTISISGGTVVASGTTSPEEGFDCDQNRFSITGGVLIGVGGSTSTPTTSACTQYAVKYGSSGTAGQVFSVVASSGASVLSYTIPRAYSQMTVLFSSASLVNGTGYTIYSGGSVSGGNTFHRFVAGGIFNASSATTLTTFTPGSSKVISLGSTSGNQGGGGRW